MRRGILFAALTAATLLVPVHGAQALAPTWTEIASNTTQDITALEYQGDDRFWFTTRSGKIFRRVGGTFQEELNAVGVIFNDIEFNGNNGLAVGNGGKIYRSANAGDTWVLEDPGMSQDSNCNAALAVGDIQKVAFGDAAVAYAFGARNQVLRSANAGDTWNATYNDGGAACKIDFGDPVTGAFFVPGAVPITAYLQTDGFGELYFTSNDLTTGQLKQSGINGFTTPHRIAGDPSDPARQWGIAINEGGNGSYFSRTTDGWASNQSWEEGNPTKRQRDSANDIAALNGTVLTAGATGQIMNSIDGRTFFYIDATGALALQEWNAVGLASAAKGAVGGRNGKLAISENVNAVPDVTKPTGTISCPATVNVGQPAACTSALADEAGGSGINPASLAWTSAGLPGQSGPTAAFTFGTTGFKTVRLAFRDNEGNAGDEASASVQVVNPAGGGGTTPPTPRPISSRPKTSNTTVAGGTVSFTVPGCIRAGVPFTVRLTWRKSRRKGALFVRVRRADFYVGTRRQKIDRKAPFTQRLVIRNPIAGRTYRVRARAFIKVRRGRSPTKSIFATVRTCT